MYGVRIMCRVFASATEGANGWATVGLARSMARARNHEKCLMQSDMFFFFVRCVEHAMRCMRYDSVSAIAGHNTPKRGVLRTLCARCWKAELHVWAGCWLGRFLVWSYT